LLQNFVDDENNPISIFATQANHIALPSFITLTNYTFQIVPKLFSEVGSF